MNFLKNIGNMIGNIFGGTPVDLAFKNFFKILFGMFTELLKPVLGAFGLNVPAGSSEEASRFEHGSNVHAGREHEFPYHSAKPKQRFTGSGISGYAHSGNANAADGVAFSNNSKKAGLGKDKRVRFTDDATRRMRHRDLDSSHHTMRP